MKILLIAATLSAGSEALVPCDGVFTTPVPAWVCEMETPRPDTPVSAEMQAEINQAWEQFLDEKGD